MNEASAKSFTDEVTVTTSETNGIFLASQSDDDQSEEDTEIDVPHTEAFDMGLMGVELV